jgi:hypothetical protein
MVSKKQQKGLYTQLQSKFFTETVKCQCHISTNHIMTHVAHNKKKKKNKKNKKKSTLAK